MTTTAGAPTGPMLRWPGGSWRIAPWVISHIPASAWGYIEPYCGSASVLLQMPRRHFEVLADQDDHITTLARVLRDPYASRELAYQVRHTYYARAEFDAAWPVSEPGLSDIEIARRLVVRSWMGFAARAASAERRCGFRGRVSRRDARGHVASTSWARYPERIRELHERLRGVLIESRPALDVIRQYDAPGLAMYCDPPYLFGVRSRPEAIYRHEMTDSDHRDLAEALCSCESYVVVGGYASPEYAAWLPGWQMVTRRSQIDHGLSGQAAWREECLWISPRTWRALQQDGPRLEQMTLELGEETDHD